MADAGGPKAEQGWSVPGNQMQALHAILKARPTRMTGPWVRQQPFKGEAWVGRKAHPRPGQPGTAAPA